MGRPVHFPLQDSSPLVVSEALFPGPLHESSPAVAQDTLFPSPLHES
jgi:hypothetical protein